jgi:hypothetical protein
MQFFLYEILGRAAAIYGCFDCSRTLWSGFVERRITFYLARTDILDWLFTSPSKCTFARDDEPIQYWLTVGLQIILLLACSVVAIFGWFHPDS